MKKIVSLLLALLLLSGSLLSLASCDVVSELLGNKAEKPTITLEGTYECVPVQPMTIVFEGDAVSVKAGRRTLVGTYEIVIEDGEHSIIFDFGNSNSIINGIATGKQPLSEGTHRGIDYILIFGIRYNKVADAS